MPGKETKPYQKYISIHYLDSKWQLAPKCQQRPLPPPWEHFVPSQEVPNPQRTDGQTERHIVDDSFFMLFLQRAQYNMHDSFPKFSSQQPCEGGLGWLAQGRPVSFMTESGFEPWSPTPWLLLLVLITIKLVPECIPHVPELWRGPSFATEISDMHMSKLNLGSAVDLSHTSGKLFAVKLFLFFFWQHGVGLSLHLLLDLLTVNCFWNLCIRIRSSVYF